MFGGHFAFSEVAFNDIKILSREGWRSILPTEEETSLTPTPRRRAALSPAGDETWSTISPSGDEAWSTISPSGDETWTDLGPRIT